MSKEIDKMFKIIDDLKEDEEEIKNINKKFKNKHEKFIELVKTISDIEHVFKYANTVKKFDDIEGKIICEIEEGKQGLKKLFKEITTLNGEINNDITIDSFMRINHFSPIDDMNFDVFSPFKRRLLKAKIEQIHQINNREKNSDNQNKPICVFIPGAPGTGKTYFVKQFDRYLRSADEDVCTMKDQKDYWKNFPNTSLSGVSEANFYQSIRNHIDKVFDAERNKCPRTKIAFLDEVDTKAGNVLSFRFLMDAMTGEFTDEKGELLKDSNTRNLIWMFAGSVGKTRESFIENFHGEDRKIADFFDRIHFDLELPSVDRPGQAILMFLSSLYREYEDIDDPKPEQFKRYIKVRKEVLYLFGATQWDSARQIKTVCRVATSKKSFNWNKPISLNDFKGITNFEEFVKTWKYLNDIVEVPQKNQSGFKEVILVKYPKESK